MIALALTLSLVACAVADDRASLDEALLARCRTAADGLHSTSVQRCAWRPDGCQVSLADGTALSVEAVVDTSGLRRASFGSIASHVGAPVPVDEGPAGGGYASVALRGMALPQGRVGHRLQDRATGHRAVLLRERGGAGRLTLQMHPTTPLPRSRDALLAVLRAFDDTRLHDIVSQADLDPVATWAGQRPSRVALEALPDLPPGWLPLGDALLTTPPHFGQGLAQIVVQVEALDAQLRAGARLATIRQALCEAASVQWFHVTVMEGLTLG